MPVYTFQLASFLRGRPVQVRADGSSTVVASGTLDTNSQFTATLAVGDYVASASDGRYTYKSAGTVPKVDPDGALTDGSVDAAVAAAVNSSGSQTRTALNSTYPTKTEAAATYGLVSESVLPRPASAPQPPYGGMIASANFAGHGWVDGGGSTGTINFNATDAPVQYGTQAIKITTNGTGGATRVMKTGLTYSMAGKSPTLWVAVDNPTRVLQIQVFLGDAGFANYYRFDFESGNLASINDRFVRANKLHRLTLGWGALAQTGGTPNRAALTQVQVTVFDRGATGGGAVKAWVFGVGAQPEPTTLFPNGVCTFSFDDGYVSQWDRAMPVLDKYGYQATALPIVDRIGQAGRVTLAQLKSMQDDHGWEIGAHAYSTAVHDGFQGFNNLSEAALDTELRNLRRWLLANGFQGADMLAYPQGYHNDLVMSVAKRYFAAARSQHLFYRDTVPPADRMRVRTWNLGNQQTLAATTALVDEAAANKEWLVFTFHDIVASGASTGSQWNLADFQALVDYVKSKDMAVRTMGDVLRRV